MSLTIVKKPALLTVGMVFSTLFGACFLLGFGCAVFDIGSFNIDGEPVSAREFLAHSGVILFVFGSVLLAIAFSIWKDKPWSRWMIVFFWLCGAAIGIGTSLSSADDLFQVVFSWVVFMAISVWYLFGKRTVREYYRSLEAASKETQTAPEDSSHA